MPETIGALVRDLSNPDRALRRAAEDTLVALGAGSVDQLLPHTLDAPKKYVRRDVQSIIEGFGSEALPRLRNIRREGPGRLRGKALEILVDLGGPEALDEVDQRAVERLVRIKLLNETKVSVPLEAGRWLAFPADRLQDVVSSFGLHHVRPVTTVMGVAAATQIANALDFRDSQEETQRAYRVFITPEFENWLAEGPIKNWRMLWGNSFLDELWGFGLATELSKTCGEAHFYVLDPYNAAECWHIARNGHVIRSYGTYAEPQFQGERLPFEAQYLEDAYDEEEAEKYAEGVPDADAAANNLSIGPGPMLAEDTHGRGWLATTHPDAPHTRFKGALPI